MFGNVLARNGQTFLHKHVLSCICKLFKHHPIFGRTNVGLMVLIVQNKSGKIGALKACSQNSGGLHPPSGAWPLHGTVPSLLEALLMEEGQDVGVLVLLGKVKQVYMRICKKTRPFYHIFGADRILRA